MCRNPKNIMYVNHTRKTDVIEVITYLDLAESEYRIFYRGQKWKKSKNDLASGFHVNDIGATGSDGDSNFGASNNGRSGCG